MKLIQEKILFVLASLILAGILYIFSMNSRLGAVEQGYSALEYRTSQKFNSIDERMTEFSLDLKVVRCLLKDEFTCKAIGMKKTKSND